MQPRSIPWLWIAVGVLLLLGPGPAGRLLIDLLGGLTLTLILLPLLLAGAGWIGWRILQSRLRSCEVCGFTGLGGEVCPACGAAWGSDSSGSAAGRSGATATPGFPGRATTVGGAVEARSQVIDVQATDVTQADGTQADSNRADASGQS